MNRSRRTTAAAGLARVLALAGSFIVGQAFAAEPFYRGKTIRVVISTGVAGGYMEYARALTRHLADHIEGAPSFVVESMPGAGGLLASNYLYTQASRDGLTMALVHSTIPLAPLYGLAGARYDALKFNWLGALDHADGVCTVWQSSPVHTLDDMKSHQMIVGSQGAGAQADIYPAILNRFLGTKVRIVTGYHSGTDIDLAMERGEIEGRCGTHLNTYKAMRADWMRNGLVRIPVVFAGARLKDFPDAPDIFEFIREEAVRRQIDLLLTTQYIDRPVLMPPGVPEARVAEIESALAATAVDPAFLADLARNNFTFGFVDRDAMTARIRQAYEQPAETVTAARALMGAQ